MIKKRFISMLVLLAAVATGARADWTGETYTATATENLGAITVNTDATLTINEGVTVTVTGGINVASGTLTVTGPGTLVVTGNDGNDGVKDVVVGGAGGTGGVAISGNIIVQGGATVTATGGNGGKGGYGNDYGGTGGTGGVAISGNIIVQGGATVTATGGNGGTGGNGFEIGGKGGNGGNAFAGTLTYKSGTVTANGGSGGTGGSGEEGNGSSGSAGKAFANDVDFTQTTGYSVTNGTSTIESVLNQTKVVISGGTPIPTGYSVSLKSGTDDATSWKGKAGEAAYQELPLESVAAGTAVSVKYNGTKKVKSVKAKKKVKPAATVTTAPTAKTGVKAGEDVAIVNEGAAEGGTMMYMVNATQPASTEGFSATVPTAEGLTAGTYYVWYYVKADDSHTDSEISATGIEVTIEAAVVPVTYTALSGGEVLHVGDIIEVPDGKEWYINTAHYLMPNHNPFTVVRANITGEEEEVTVTEAADGAYYVIKDKDGNWYFTSEIRRLPVTGTSDGIYVTSSGFTLSGTPKYTFSVHEK